MKTFTLFSVIFLLFSASGFSSWDGYIIEKTDGSFEVMGYNNKSKTTVEQAIEEVYGSDVTWRKAEPGDIPATKEDHEAWELKNGKISVSEAKKQQAEDKKAQKEARKAAALSKLKITEAELKDILDK